MDAISRDDQVVLKSLVGPLENIHTIILTLYLTLYLLQFRGHRGFWKLGASFQMLFAEEGASIGTRSLSREAQVGGAALGTVLVGPTFSKLMKHFAKKMFKISFFIPE